MEKQPKTFGLTRGIRFTSFFYIVDSPSSPWQPAALFYQDARSAYGPKIFSLALLFSSVEIAQLGPTEPGF